MQSLFLQEIELASTQVGCPASGMRACVGDQLVLH